MGCEASTAGPKTPALPPDCRKGFHGHVVASQPAAAPPPLDVDTVHWGASSFRGLEDGSLITSHADVAAGVCGSPADDILCIRCHEPATAHAGGYVCHDGCRGLFSVSPTHSSRGTDPRRSSVGEASSSSSMRS